MKKIIVWKDYSKIGVLHQSNGYTVHFCCIKKKKKQLFIMSPTVGDLFKSPTGNRTSLLVGLLKFLEKPSTGA